MAPDVYSLTDRLLLDNGMIEICDVSGRCFASFSCQFLCLGHVLSWKFIIFACGSVVEEAGRPYMYHTQNDPTPPPIASDQSPTAGRYLYLRIDDVSASCTLAIGPNFKYARRGPSTRDDDSETMSHLSRSSMNQNRFRWAVAKKASRITKKKSSQILLNYAIVNDIFYR